MQMGRKLFKAYVDAGLSPPHVPAEAALGEGAHWPGYDYVAATLRSRHPGLLRLTGLKPAAVQIDTLAARLQEDVVGRNAVRMLPIVFGAWTRKTDGRLQGSFSAGTARL